MAGEVTGPRQFAIAVVVIPSQVFMPRAVTGSLRVGVGRPQR
jgi:hypothetical protein